MVSANLRYRNFIPWNYIAVECSNVDFYGDTNLVNLLNRLRGLIEFEKYDNNRTIISDLEEKQKVIYNEWMQWVAEVEDFKEKHPFWKLNKKYREEMLILKEECSRLENECYLLNYKIKNIESSSFFSASELTIKFKNLLANLGFTCRSTVRDDSNLVKEVYESTCSDRELLQKVENMIKKLQSKNNSGDNEIDFEDDNEDCNNDLFW